jgi:hypothetical protein
MDCNIKDAILKNDPIEDKLHVVIVIFNPCNYKSRYALAKQFIQTFQKYEKDVILYIVELIYPDQEYVVTDKNNPRHLQLFTEFPLWHKENLINIGIKRLLPPSWKAVAWIDADIEFESTTWATDTLKLLNGEFDILQLFSQVINTDYRKYTKNISNISSSGGYQYSKCIPYLEKGLQFWHPGFAWACTREAYQRMGEIFDLEIIGNGDIILMTSIIHPMKIDYTRDRLLQYSKWYVKSLLKFKERVKGFKFGYVPGVIISKFHGKKKNRKYRERCKILFKYKFDPSIHIQKDINGVIIPTEKCPKGLLDEIMGYFKDRKEDELFQLKMFKCKNSIYKRRHPLKVTRKIKNNLTKRI